MFIPGGLVSIFDIALRPLVYASLATAVFAMLGRDLRRTSKAYHANMVAILSCALFGIAVLILSFNFGVGTNAIAPELSVIVRNFWQYGSIVVFGEIIRFKLIKDSAKRNHTVVIVLLSIVLAYGQMNALRMIAVGADLWHMFFITVFGTLVVSAVASYFALKGSFASVLIFSFVYNMFVLLSPALPVIPAVVFALITSGLAFVSAVVFRFIVDEKSQKIKIREKRAAKYMKRSVIGSMVTAAIITVAIAFFIGVFPIYPVVVLTDSMAGTFERGSIVFIERTPSDEVFLRVDEGYVIHFVARGGAEYIHRVVDFRFDAFGEREYITQGDASEFIDPFPVPQDDVLGIARATLPFFGYPYIIIQNLFR